MTQLGLRIYIALKLKKLFPKKKIFFIYSRKQELKKSKYIKDVLNVLKKAESKKIFQII